MTGKLIVDGGREREVSERGGGGREGEEVAGGVGEGDEGTAKGSEGFEVKEEEAVGERDVWRSHI